MGLNRGMRVVMTRIIGKRKESFTFWQVIYLILTGQNVVFQLHTLEDRALVNLIRKLNIARKVAIGEPSSFLTTPVSLP